ncbi:hypothetical protein H4R35_001942 [Dimargaris xerosporica]|nr:hypothetical protein H4R35_001942 [Dimargaris xerosporica]
MEPILIDFDDYENQQASDYNEAAVVTESVNPDVNAITQTQFSYLQQMAPVLLDGQQPPRPLAQALRPNSSPMASPKTTDTDSPIPASQSSDLQSAANVITNQLPSSPLASPHPEQTTGHRPAIGLHARILSQL